MSVSTLSSWILALMLLVACDNSTRANVANVAKDSQVVSLPALPVIQSAVMVLVPMHDGQRNELLMSEVCALARGESTPLQVAQKLMHQGIDLSTVPPQGHPLSLLVDPDKSRRITACAAYIASSVMMLPKTDVFMVQVPAGSSTRKRKLQIDPKKLSSFMRIQLAVANTNADVFALIATRLEKTHGLTLEQYHQQAKTLFVELAPLYLQRIKSLFVLGQSAQYALLEYSDSSFKFTSSSGYLFEYGYDGMNLSFNRTPWYGGGKLLGKTYMLDVDYLANLRGQ